MSNSKWFIVVFYFIDLLTHELKYIRLAIMCNLIFLTLHIKNGCWSSLIGDRQEEDGFLQPVAKVKLLQGAVQPRMHLCDDATTEPLQGRCEPGSSTFSNNAPVFGHP